jgi:ammonia channel protein AmtB
MVGFFSLLACGIFDKDKGFLISGKPDFLIVQIIGSLSLTLWAGTISFIFFYVLKKVNRLRIDGLFEIIGIDNMSKDRSEIHVETIRRLILLRHGKKRLSF